jgi:hypothetical protein
MLAGCSWVPDAINPVEWYRGVAGAFSDDTPPVIAAPRRPEGSFPDVNAVPDRQGTQRGLAGDHNNANYASSVRREPAPTKQLVRRAPPAQTQITQTPIAPPATAQAAAAPAPTGPSLDRSMRTAREEGPDAPPRTAAGGPPARPDIPNTVPTRRSTLADQYQRRLAESAQATDRSGTFDGVPPARPDSAYSLPPAAYAVPANAPVAADRGFAPTFAPLPVESAAPVLIPPRGVRGAKGAVLPPAPAASFQVAEVQGDSSGRLTETDRAALRDVAQLIKRSGGAVRIEGGLAAGAVRQALASFGVPDRRIHTLPDATDTDASWDGGVRVLIEY